MSVQPLDEIFAGHAGPWTEDDWLALPESMGRVELLDGALIVSPFPGGPHQRLVRNLVDALRHAARNQFEVFGGLNVRVSPGRIMIPDIAVISPPGLDATIYDARNVVLAVEVTSPSNAWADRSIKPGVYARARIPHYLRIDLDRGVDHLAATHYALASGGTYTVASQASGNDSLRLERPFRADLDLMALATAIW
ncbi:MAG: Uma2 family endonuclease [Pseudonocardiaceae bacterium]